MARSRAALILLLAAGLASPAAGQGQGEPVRLRADRQEWVRESYWRGQGHVELLYQDIKIRCDALEVDLETMDLHAAGGVILDQGPRRFTCDEAFFNLRTKTGRLLHASGTLEPTYSFTAEEVEKLDERRYRLTRATFTSCEPEPAPPWRFSVRRALLEEQGYGRFHGAALEVKNFPVLYVPYLLWPLKTERAAGLLPPSLGYSEHRGAYLGSELFLPLGPSYDVTVALDLYSRGTFGLGTRWRWAPVRGASGEIDLTTIRDDRTGRWEWKVDGRHRQDDLLGFSALAEVHDLSDLDFFREFERSYDRNTLRSLYSYLYLTRPLGPGALNVRLDRRRTFLSSENVIELHQLPEVEWRVRPTRIGATQAYWSLIGSFNLFSVDRGPGLATTYARADLYPRLSYSLPSPPWLSITPRVGARGTYYTARLADDRRTYEERGTDRSFVEAGLDLVGPTLSRVYGGFGPFERLKHVIEPRIEYSYTSDVGDTSRIPRFDEVDSTLVTNRVRVSLVNSVLARVKGASGAREVASLVLSEEHSFTDPLTRSLDGTRTWKRGPLEAVLHLSPTTAFSLDARLAYDTVFGGLRSSALSASWSHRGQYVAATWYESYIAETGDRTSSQVRLTSGLGAPGGPVRVQLSLNYDIERSRFVQQRAVVRYTASCWAVAVEYRDFRFGTFPTRDYRISIDFKGIGRFLEIQGGLGAPTR